MFVLGVRLWTGKNMFYPSRFTALINFENKESEIRTYTDDLRIDSKIYMMLTPYVAVNGEVYEYDIIADSDNEDRVGVVYFDAKLGAFVANINNEIIPITNVLEGYEIVGNIFEDWDEFKDIIYNPEKFENLLNLPEDMYSETPLPTKKKKNLEAQNNSENTGNNTEKETVNEELVKEEVESVVETVIPSSPKIEESPITKSPVEEGIHTEEPVEKVQTEESISENDIPLNEDPSSSEVLVNNELDESSPASIISEIELPEIDVPEETLLETDLPEYNMFDQDIVEQSDESPEMEEPDFDFQDEPQNDVKIYVDGQGEKTPNLGSYSYIMQCGDFERTDNGSETNTTKQRMELQAVISALKAVNSRCNIKIYTTSQYLIVPFLKGWITRWKANDWKKESNEEIKNKDLWEQLYELYSTQNVEWEFIKPGSSIVEILRCIDLSKEALAN